MTLFSFQFAGETFSLDGVHLLRLGFAIVLAGIIGLEREFRDKPAGFRTLILIGVGACVFSIISQFSGGPTADKTRLAAQVVTGVGFLGAGAIIRGDGSIFGLTTAATIWAVAAVGVAVGFGEYMLGASATVGILLVLLLLDVVEKGIGRVLDIQTHRFSTEKTPDVVARVRAMFKDERLRTVKDRWFEEKGEVVFDVIAKGPKAGHDRLRIRMLGQDQFTLRKPKVGG